MSIAPPVVRAIRTLCTALIIAILYVALVRTCGVQAEFGETNYQKNMIRAAKYLHGDPVDAVMLGTSITGRILPSYFSQVRVANLGMDGGTLDTAFQISLKRESLPRVVLIEARGLGTLPIANDAVILGGIETLTFRLSRWIRFLEPGYRPSAILYTQMKLGKEKVATRSSTGALAPVLLAPDPSGIVRDVSAHPPGPQIEVLEAHLREMKRRGAQIAFYRVPTGEAAEAGLPPLDPEAVELARRVDAPVLDVLGTLKARNISLSYTDGLHMKADTARAAASVIEQWASEATR